MAAEHFIFTVATGRCGQASLTELVRNHVAHCYAAFEEPDIRPILPGPLDVLERRFRRCFIETHELLGRGKVLSAYEKSNSAFIEMIAAKRLARSRNTMKQFGANIYFDISKFFARGLHVGFTKALDRYALVNLVRDPIINMCSFLNREKNFSLDNNLPDARSNILRMDSTEFAAGEFYLWSWCEMYLRYEELRQSTKVTQAILIRTEELESPARMNAAFDALGLPHTPVRALPPANTNLGRGRPDTNVSAGDIELFERFISRLPSGVLDRIDYLKSYDPRQTKARASANAA